MKYLVYILVAAAILTTHSFSHPNMVYADASDDQFLQLKIDSVLNSDSIQRMQYVQYHLDESFRFMNDKIMDSAIVHARAIAEFDVNLIPGQILVQAYYILGKVNRMEGRTDEALKNYLLAVQKLRHSNETTYSSEIYQELAVIYQDNGWTSKAIERYKDAYMIEINSGNVNEQVLLLNTIISLCMKENDLRNTVTYQEKLLSIYSKTDLRKALNLMKEIARNYVALNESQKAIYLLNQVLEATRQTGNTKEQLAAILEILKIYKEVPDFEKFYAYNDGFNRIYLNLRKKELTPGIQNIRGQSYLIHGDLSSTWESLEVKGGYRDALQYYDSAYVIFSTIGESKKAADARLAQARVYYKIEDYKAAIDQSEFAERIYIRENDHLRLTECYRLISDSYLQLDRFKPAFQAQSSFLAYSDSLEKEEKRILESQIRHYQENADRIAFRNLEQSLLQQELDTLSDMLLRLEIEKQNRNIELLIKEKSLQDLALRNEQLKNEQVTNENILLQQKIEADLREREILNLQAVKSRQETELRNQQIYQITNERQIYELEQEKKLNKLELQRANAQRTVYMLIIIISLIVLTSTVIGYLNLRRSRSKITAKNQFIEQQNARLKDLNEEKNRLIRIVAHDLKNPLTSALTIIEILHNKIRNSTPDEQNSISLIRRSLRRMHEMINKILDIKAIDSEKFNLDMESVNVKQICEYVIEMFANRARRKNIKVVNETEEIFIYADRDFMIQILENLISNALKFSQANTLVRIETRDLKDSCRIAVIDQGPGFSNLEKEKLFTENVTLTPKPTSGETSNGMGLSIVKKYAEAMGGQVWCETKLGKGSTFYLEFEKALQMA